jgi:type II secretory pathway pseudopilin PulG
MNARRAQVVYRSRSVPGGGFTLIELLVIVAIIALLIAILLPSLNRARAQARTTLCASRINQLAKAVLMYADDYGETPPFIDHGFDAPDPNECWLAEPNQMRIVLNPALTDTDWDVAGVRLPQSGTLYAYTRFTEPYRCCEFERLGNQGMMQRRFNFSRSIAARRWRPPPLLGGTGNNPLFGDFRGPILKLSAAHAPAALIMMVDEQWNRHIAGDYQYVANPDADKPMRADPVMFVYDEFGQYHGPPVKERPEFVGLYKQASVSYYDGHVELHRDPQPTDAAHPDGRPINPFNLAEAKPFLSYFFGQLFAQQGSTLDISGWF